MNRYYYVCDDLDDLEKLETELESSGVGTEQIHVLSNNDCEVDHHHHLHAVDSLSKSDVVHSGITGLVIGLVGAAAVVGAAYVSEIYQTITWVPPLFLAVVILGFCTWEGGFLGIQKSNHAFEAFKRDLEMGKHIFFVDVRADQESLLKSLVRSHPKLAGVGGGAATPEFVQGVQKRWNKFTHWAP